MTTRPDTSLRQDIAAAYAMTAARVAAMAAVSAVVYRLEGKDAFGLLFLVLTTIGILEYASLGLAPAMIHFAAKSRAAPKADDELAQVYTHGLILGILGAVLGTVGLAAALWLMRTHALLGGVPARVLVGGVGIGTILRLLAEAPGAMLQATGRIAADNLFQAGAEIVWGAGSVAGIAIGYRWDWSVGVAYAAASGLLLACRFARARRRPGSAQSASVFALDARLAGRLLAFGLAVVAAQLADYLYAPTDVLLIKHLLNTTTVADYAPAVQADSALLLLAAAVAGVLLPRAALAHARGDPAAARKYYIRGTFATAGILLAGALIAVAVAPFAFEFWLGSPMPATLAILPLVMINTVIGGSGQVGRSVLLAIGRGRALALSVLGAGLANVVCSYALVRYGHLGLRGIVLGTIIAVVGRCLIWMPWYIRRSLRAPVASL